MYNVCIMYVCVWMDFVGMYCIYLSMYVFIYVCMDVRFLGHRSRSRTKDVTKGNVGNASGENAVECSATAVMPDRHVSAGKGALY
jgi:hypothetical protein